MSHLALRRVMIRMLHDPSFVAAVYADGERALAGVDVSAIERAWLTAQPPAAWATDHARPGRVLAALGQEYPATIALAAEHAARFCASPELHAAIQHRGSLALAFGDYLGRAPAAPARVLAALERAVAVVRRADPRPAPSPAGELRLAPTASVVSVPSGALALLDAVLAHGLATDDPLGPEAEAVLVASPPGGGDVTLEPLEPALAALLIRARGGCRVENLLAEARRQGAAPGEEATIVDGLVADGLLR